ncbi:hypothetical protein [Brachybacterium hainanense]|uniref:hypothetical protein n=1 Tax=Brachybacterium hainanense TaxID=1541174 RepID=UPI003670175B
MTVSLGSGAFGVRLQVVNRTAPRRSRPASSTGYGLIGAAERAGLFGGSFDAGRDADGDWVARLSLPPGAALAAEAPRMQEAR